MSNNQKQTKNLPTTQKSMVYFVAHPKPSSVAPKQVLALTKKGALPLDFGPHLFVYSSAGNCI